MEIGTETISNPQSPIPKKMAQTVAEKIISKRLRQHVTAGDLVIVPVDGAMATDTTAPMAIRAFEEMGGKQLWDPNKVSLVLDHAIPPPNERISENFGPGTMARLGFSYEALQEQYPGLIYCTLKGFMPGPYEKRMALDEVVQMMSGLAYMTGRPGDPLRAGASVVDIMTGMNGVIGILLALREREQSGRGQLVKSTLFETAVFLVGQHMAFAAMSGQPVPPMPARLSAWGIYHQFDVAGGERVFIGVTSDKQWQRFCTVFECEAWLANERISTNNGRVENQPWLLPAIQELVGQMSREDVLARCQEANLPFSPIARPEDLFTDPQLLAGNSLLETKLPDGRQTQLPKIPIRLGTEDFAIRTDPPAVGQQTTELLQELGYTRAEIANLEKENVVRQYS